MDYAAWVIRTLIADLRTYGWNTARWNLYVHLRCVVDARFREEYGGWHTRYRYVGDGRDFAPGEVV
jgi:hypothetical protein